LEPGSAFCDLDQFFDRPKASGFQGQVSMGTRKPRQRLVTVAPAGSGRGVASPSVKPNAHLIASNYIWAMSRVAGNEGSSLMIVPLATFHGCSL